MRHARKAQQPQQRPHRVSALATALRSFALIAVLVVLANPQVDVVLSTHP